MATPATFVAHVQPVPTYTDTLMKNLKGVGYRLDTRAWRRLDVYRWNYDPENIPDIAICIILTPRDLGCKDFPDHTDLRSKQRLFAASKRYLPQGKVLEACPPEVLTQLCMVGHECLGDVLTAFDYGYQYDLLQSVHLPNSSAREKWLYGVPVESKRWSLDHRFLFTVRAATPKEQEEINAAEVPTSLKANRMNFCHRDPPYIEDSRPGFYCAQLAARSILGAYGYPSKEGNYFKHALPSQVTRFLWDYACLRAPWRVWWKSKFERLLVDAINHDHLVNVVLYAQRRKHGQHNQIVCGYLRYGREHWWMVRDSQFAEEEYDLPRGNVLLSTDELISHFPKYGFWLFRLFALVNIVFSK